MHSDNTPIIENVAKHVLERHAEIDAQAEVVYVAGQIEDLLTYTGASSAPSAATEEDAQVCGADGWVCVVYFHTAQDCLSMLVLGEGKLTSSMVLLDCLLVFGLGEHQLTASMVFLDCLLVLDWVKAN